METLCFESKYVSCELMAFMVFCKISWASFRRRAQCTFGGKKRWQLLQGGREGCRQIASNTSRPRDFPRQTHSFIYRLPVALSVTLNNERYLGKLSKVSKAQNSSDLSPLIFRAPRNAACVSLDTGIHQTPPKCKQQSPVMPR